LCFFIYNYVKFPFICVVQIKWLNANNAHVCKTSDRENVFAGNNTTLRSTNSILFMSPINNSDHCYRCFISATNKVVYKINHHHHHHHHISFMELGHLLTRSGLTYPEVSSKVHHDSFCQLGSSISLPW